MNNAKHIAVAAYLLVAFFSPVIVAGVPYFVSAHVSGAEGPLHDVVTRIEDATDCGLVYQTAPPSLWPVGVTCMENVNEEIYR